MLNTASDLPEDRIVCRMFLLLVLTVLLHFDRKKAKKAAVEMNGNGDSGAAAAAAARSSTKVKQMMKSEYDKLGRMQGRQVKLNFDSWIPFRFNMSSFLVSHTTMLNYLSS